jgi:hypothetical protein
VVLESLVTEGHAQHRQQGGEQNGNLHAALKSSVQPASQVPS